MGSLSIFCQLQLEEAFFVMSGGQFLVLSHISFDRNCFSFVFQRKTLNWLESFLAMELCKVALTIASRVDGRLWYLATCKKKWCFTLKISYLISMVFSLIMIRSQAIAQSDYFGLSIQSKATTNMWFRIQIQIWISKWIDNPNLKSDIDFGLSITIQSTKFDSNPDWAIQQYYVRSGMIFS